jgi:hypothetical protein
VVGIVDDHHRPGAQARLYETEHRRVERLGTIQEHKVEGAPPRGSAPRHVSNCSLSARVERGANWREKFPRPTGGIVGRSRAREAADQSAADDHGVGEFARLHRAAALRQDLALVFAVPPRNARSAYLDEYDAWRVDPAFSNQRSRLLTQ